MELNGLKEVLVDYGDIHLNILHSLLTWGVRDYKLFITIFASKWFAFFFFFSFFIPSPPFFFSDEQVFTKDTIVTATFNWSSVTEWREQDFMFWGNFVQSLNSNGRKGESVGIICPNLCFLNGEKEF